MSSSRDWRPEEERILRGDGAREVAAANFAIDLSSAVPMPSALVVQAAEQARTAGYAKGWAQGQQAARVAAQATADQVAAAEGAAAQARTMAIQRAVAAVGAAAADLDAREMPALAALSDAILSATVEVTEAIIGYEVTHAEDGPLAAARRAMSLVPDGGAVTVRLHPEDHRALVGQGGSTYAVDGRPITVRADPTLDPGDAIAEYGVTTVDATLTAALARVREALHR